MPRPDDVEDDDAAGDVASASVELSPVTVVTVARVGVVAESAVEAVEEDPVFGDETASFLVAVVEEPPVSADPPDSPDPPEAPAG